MATSFLYDETDLSYPKSDRVPLPVGADPEEYVVAEDWNDVCQAAVDLRAGILDGKFFGFEPVVDDSDWHTAGRPYLYYTDDDKLWLHKADDSYVELTDLTLADGEVTYAKIQDVSATQRVLGRNTAGAGDVEEVTASQLLDWVGSTRGAVLYRGAAGWAVLAPGTATHVLTSNGAGADPSYQAPAGGFSGSIATGQVAFASGANALTGEADLYYDTTNNRLGINTASSPSLNLDVRGSVTTEIAQLYNTSASGLSALLCKNHSGSSVVSFGYGNSSYADADLRRAFVWVQAVDFTITDGTAHFLYVDRANNRVGLHVGTAPTHPLHLETGNGGADMFKIKNTSSTGASSVIYYDEGGTARATFGYGNSLHGTTARASKTFLSLNSSDFTITNDTVNYFHVDVTNNRIGLGTSAPTVDFHFVQPTRTSGNAPNGLAVIGAAHTGLTAGSAWRGLSVGMNQTITFAAGAHASGALRVVQLRPPTIAYASASTAADPATLWIEGPPLAGANATFTNAFSFYVESGRVCLKTAVALGGGAAPTLGTIGGSGPATAAQNEWIEITTQNGRRWVPAWA